MKNVRWVILGLIFMLALSACQSAPTPAPSAAAAPQVTSLVAQGYLQPLRSVDLAFSSGGRVAEVLVKEGDAVKQGQVLARLELVGVEARQADWVRAEQEVLAAGQAIGSLTDAAAGALVQAKFAVADLEKQIDAAQTAVADAKEPEEGDPDPLVIAQAEARQALLEQQLIDAQKLVTKLGNDGVDQDKLAAAQARQETAYAALLSAQAAAKPVELSAPWDGVVGSTSLVAGQFVSPGQAVIGLADFSAWVVQTDNLTEIEVVGLKAGDSAEIVLDALADQKFSGSIQSIRPRFEQKRGDITYTVTLNVQNLPADALWGMTAAVTFSR